jgi:hypothetical protein
VKQSQTVGEWFPAGRVFLQGIFLETAETRRFTSSFIHCRSDFRQIPCAAGAGNFVVHSRDFFAGYREFKASQRTRVRNAGQSSITTKPPSPRLNL